MAEFEKRLACVIGADRKIARRGYMIESCKLGGENEYVITWKVPLLGLMSNPTQMHVHTYDAAGKPAKRPFHLACFRDS